MNRLIILLGILTSLTSCAQSETVIPVETDTIHTEFYEFQIPVTFLDESNKWKGCIFCPEHTFFDQSQCLSENYEGVPPLISIYILKLENASSFKEVKKSTIDRITDTSKRFKQNGGVAKIPFKVSDTTESIILRTRFSLEAEDHDSYNTRFVMISYSEEHEAACVFTVQIIHDDRTFDIEDELDIIGYAKNLYKTLHWK